MAITTQNPRTSPIPAPLSPDGGASPAPQRQRQARPLFDPAIVRRAIKDAFVKLDPRVQARNPVMFVVWVGSVVTTLFFVQDIVKHVSGWETAFVGQIALWLWFTVLFANFAEAIAEGRGKAQADELRKTRTTTLARRVGKGGQIEEVPAPSLRKGDCRPVRGGRYYPERRHGDRRHRQRGRVRDHRRERSGNPRGGRRPLRRHRRHEGDFRPDYKSRSPRIPARRLSTG